MEIKSLLLLVSLLAYSFILLDGVSGTVRPSRSLLGGWKPIVDVDDPFIHEIAEYAVSQHNKEAKTKLVPNELIQGETQSAGGGTSYRLIIAAKEGSAIKKYEAVVLEKGGTPSSLTSFRQI
uniref:Cystatin domain-containing protein n=1 Tax=Nelumbo nucifera TaxID=4432 RepID=A0A822Z390_NELNU|nr:TPA_asm: hypothetical protein HUJ06_013580 [Nelumbo nucifera]